MNSILQSKGKRVPSVRSDVINRDVLHRLEEEDVGALVVTDDDVTLLGIISERDIVRGLQTIGENVLEAGLFDPIHSWPIRAIP